MEIEIRNLVFLSFPFFVPRNGAIGFTYNIIQFHINATVNVEQVSPFITKPRLFKIGCQF